LTGRGCTIHGALEQARLIIGGSAHYAKAGGIQNRLGADGRGCTNKDSQSGKNGPAIGDGVELAHEASMPCWCRWRHEQCEIQLRIVPSKA
jgi:hypothetical protein